MSANQSPYLKLVETTFDINENELNMYHDQAKSNGYEGIMLRHENGKYKQGPSRSSDLFKLKSMTENEYIIVGCKEGLGLDAGTVIWVCETEINTDNGLEKVQFAVRPKGSREERKQWFSESKKYIGKPLTVRFQELTKDGIPRFPVGIAIRDYE